MLDLMRRNAKSWLVKLALFAVVVVFIFWGIGGIRGRKEGVVASVNDYEITQKEYQTSYNNLIRLYQRFYPEGIPQETMEKLNLRRMALENLITRVVLLKETERLSLGVSPEELRQKIESTPSFQESGVFSRERYVQFLNYNRVTPEEFENELKIEMLISKLETTIKGMVKVSEKEVYDTYRAEKQEIDVWFLKIEPLRVQEKEFTEKELREYFDAHAEAFRAPVMVRFQYLIFDPKNYEEKISIPLQDMAAIYQSSPGRFSEPKKVRARHILIKTPSTEKPEVLQEARKRAEEIGERARKGEDFANLARKYSEDVGTAKNGGDLGYFQPGQMAKPFEQAAFSLSKGEISPVIQTQYGFHIIKVEDVVEARVKPLEEVKDEIARELQLERAGDFAEKEAKQAYNELFRRKDLERYARERGVPIRETSLSSIKDLQERGIERELVDAAFSLKKETVSTVIKTPPRYYLLKVVERQEQHIPPLPEVRGKVEMAVQREKGRLLAQERADRILAQLKKGEAIEAVALREKITLQNTGFFSRRGDAVPKIGSAGEIKEAAFSLTPDHPYAEKPFFTGDCFYLIRLKEKKEAGMDQFRAEKEAFRQTVLRKKENETFRVWLENTKKGYKVEIESKAF